MRRLLQCTYEEHRSIAAVLPAMEALRHEARARGQGIAAKVFRAMLYDLGLFPKRVHQPREQTLLFAKLRARTVEGDSVLEALEREHAGDEAAIRDLEQARVGYEEGGAAEFAASVGAVERFVAGYRDPMRREEHEVMPLAERALLPEDLSEVEAAFAMHRDPLAGASADYDRFFQRIVMLAPAPIGLGRPT